MSSPPRIHFVDYDMPGRRYRWSICFVLTSSTDRTYRPDAVTCPDCQRILAERADADRRPAIGIGGLDE